MIIRLYYTFLVPDLVPPSHHSLGPCTLKPVTSGRCGVMWCHVSGKGPKKRKITCVV